MIDTVLFDIGTVLVRFDWEPYLRRMVPDKAAQRRVDEAMFRSGLWDEVDRGVWTEEETLDAFIRRAPADGETIRRVYAHLGEGLHKQDYTDAWIADMKQAGYRVLYLSNYSHNIIAQTPEDFSFLEQMDGGVFSCDVHLLKPDPAIYTTCLETYRLCAENCLFLDDRADNCAAAEACGIHAVQFCSYRQARADAQRILEQYKR